MNRKSLEELLAAYAVGALEPAEAAHVETLAHHNPRVREDLASLLDTAAALAEIASPPVAPPPALRARILASIATSQPATPPPVPAGFQFILNSPEGWVESGAPGFRSKVLAGAPESGYQVILGELAPGGRVPEHDHTGSEELYVISGHLHTEGRILGPGDFLHADAGTHHHELISPDGCIALLIFGTASAAA